MLSLDDENVSTLSEFENDIVVFGGTKIPNTQKLPKLTIKKGNHSQFKMDDKVRILLPKNDKYMNIY